MTQKNIILPAEEMPRLFSNGSGITPNEPEESITQCLPSSRRCFCSHFCLSYIAGRDNECRWQAR